MWANKIYFFTDAGCDFSEKSAVWKNYGNSDFILHNEVFMVFVPVFMGFSIY